MDLLLELLYCIISVWGTCLVPFRKSETAANHRVKESRNVLSNFPKRFSATFMTFFIAGEKTVKEISIAYFSNPTEIALTSV